MALPGKTTPCPKMQNKTKQSKKEKKAVASLKIFYVSVYPLEFISGNYYILKLPKIDAVLMKL